jgi:3'(2'), 5'-bisphosphate nucleotidase
LNQTFGGASGAMAMRVRDGGAPEPIRARAPDPDGLVAIQSRSHKDQAALDAFLADYTVKSSTDAGSSLKFCM